ncbi:MAG TPA: AgmX/PglI C-terminal domain-containing protein [Nannocystis sp.]
MTTLRITRALCLLALGLAVTTGCKKGSTTTPDDASPGGDAAGSSSDDGDGGGGGYDGPTEEILTVDSFEETMQGKQNEVADCFAQAKEAKPDLAGKLALDITVAGDGSVKSVKFDEGSTIQEASITACVEEKAKGWKFPKTRDGNDMTLPYALNLQ